MSFILLGILNSQTSGGAGAAFFANLFNNGAIFTYNAGVNKKLVTNGTTLIGADQAGLIVKFSPSGSILWQKTVANTTGDKRVFGTRGMVSFGNDHFAMFQDEVTGNSDLVIMKLSDTPSITAQRRLGSAANFKVDNADIAVDTSGNILAGGHSEASPNFIVYGLWNSSLTLQFQRRVLASSGSMFNPRFAFDASGNILCASQWNASPTRVNLVKWNSSGTAQWQRTLTGTSAMPQTSVTADSSDNVYVSYRDQNTSGWGVGLAKWNSSGTLQFQKTLSRVNWNYSDNAKILTHSDGNIYALHEIADDVGQRLQFLVSYDVSGNVNWQRYLIMKKSGVTQYTGATYLAEDDNANLVISGYFIEDGTTTRGFVAVVKSDGDFIGTWTNDVYDYEVTAGAHSLSTTSYTGATPTHSVDASSLTEASSSLSLGSVSLTERVINIG